MMSFLQITLPPFTRVIPKRPVYLAALLCVVFSTFCRVFADDETNRAAVDSFEKNVRPILVKHCYECHGPDTDKGEASLRLDTLAGILKGGESGPGVVPGKPFESLLIHAVTHDPAVAAMPPEKRLSNYEIATLTRWVQIKPPWPVAGFANKLRRPTKDKFHITQEDRRFWAFVRPRRPMTPRVRNGRWVRNRIWRWHMGKGIVESVDNFGRLGRRPRNPKLLDWLAAQFIESGWSIKEMHRTIMTSHAYQASSQAGDAAQEKDPENALFSYMAPRRLQAEEIRDSLLSLAGLLDLEMGGITLPVRNHKIMNTAEINKCNAVHRQPRRTVYLPVIRSGLEEFLVTFDFPDPSVPAGKRSSTIVAPQALYMMNSPLVADSSRKIARRVITQAATDNRSRIRYVYELMLSRIPTGEEVQQWDDFLEQRAAIEDASEVSDTQTASWESMVRVLFSSNDFMYVK